jgi:hypothetical protein
LALIGLFRSRASLQAEILTLRHQLNVLRGKSPQRLTFSSIDRLVFAGLYRLAPEVYHLNIGYDYKADTRMAISLNFTGNFAILGPPKPISLHETTVPQRFLANREFLTNNREFHARLERRACRYEIIGGAAQFPLICGLRT